MCLVVGFAGLGWFHPLFSWMEWTRFLFSCVGRVQPGFLFLLETYGMWVEIPATWPHMSVSMPSSLFLSQAVPSSHAAAPTPPALAPRLRSAPHPALALARLARPAPLHSGSLLGDMSSLTLGPPTPPLGLCSIPRFHPYSAPRCLSPFGPTSEAEPQKWKLTFTPYFFVKIDWNLLNKIQNAIKLVC